MNHIGIGILGASGDIGQHIAEALLRTPVDPERATEFRLAARRPEAIQAPVGASKAASRARITTCACDVRDQDSLARLADGLDVVVDATGPSHDRALTTASTVLAAGASYVDVGGPADVRALQEASAVEQVALFHAGALPGASGILPRWLLGRNPRARTLTVFIGGRGVFTRTGAEDYLAGLKYGDVEPLAAWRDGRRVSQGAQRQENVIIDGFPDPVSLFPYLDSDAEAIARESGLKDGTWYSAMVGQGIMDLLMLAIGMGLETGSSWLHDASVAKAAGRRPYVVLIAETETEKIMLRAPSEGVLSAEVAAAATREVLSGRVPAGRGCAAAVLDPDRVLTTLMAPETACTFVTTQDVTTDVMEEGAL